jgi:hypothetical protein
VSIDKKFLMKRCVFLLLLPILLIACKKEHGSRVDVYLLKSFAASLDTTKTPAVNIIKNAILNDTPLLADEDIKYYTKENCTFTCRKDIQSLIQNYGHDKAFAVTVNSQVIYYGVFHPMYLSSFTYGVAIITPFLLQNKELRVDFTNLTGTYVSQLDKRNDRRILEVFSATGRLK